MRDIESAVSQGADLQGFCSGDWENDSVTQDPKAVINPTCKPHADKGREDEDVLVLQTAVSYKYTRAILNNLSGNQEQPWCSSRKHSVSSDAAQAPTH